ncbi:carbohydrate esterase family 12 protein, partial [Sphaerulina musiva SO2202]
MAATAVADESLPASGSNEGNPSSVEDSAEEQVSLRKRDEDDTGKSAGTNNGEPGGTNNGEPAGTKNGQPAGTNNGKPVGTNNGKPAGTKNGQPAGTNNGKPAGSKNGEPAGTNNGKPAGTHKPAGTNNGEPAGNNNGKPKTGNNHKVPVKLERQGWGSALPEFMKIQIVNLAISGRSARSYTNENRFKTLATKVKKGDYVVIQFGHNDVGTPKSKIDNGRAACPPVNNKYSTTCKTTFHGKPETVLTYYTYLVQAAKLLKSKGANVIILSPTPNNPFASGTYKFKANIFAKYAADAAKAADVTFIDHGNVTSALFQNMTAKVVDSYYQGATHFTPAGARVIAHEFVEALESSESTLKKYVTSD